MNSGNDSVGQARVQNAKQQNYMREGRKSTFHFVSINVDIDQGQMHDFGSWWEFRIQFPDGGPDGDPQLRVSTWPKIF